MEANPYAKDDHSNTSAYFRLAVAFLTKHKLALSPFHFRMAYDAKELEQVREESSTDALTGVGNHNALDNMMGECVSAAGNAGGE